MLVKQFGIDLVGRFEHLVVQGFDSHSWGTTGLGLRELSLLASQAPHGVELPDLQT